MTFIAKAPKIDVRRLRKKKSYEAEEVLRRLNAFLDKNFEEPMKILRHFWQDQQDAMTYAELREAIKAGHLTDETARAWRHDYAKLVNDHLSHTWRNALALGPSGQPSMDNLTSFRLDMQKPGVLNWIGSRAADFVTNEVQEQKDAIRSVLMRGVTNQHTVDEMARVIRPLVGLNKPQTIANYNYYNHMVKTLTEQHPRTSAASIQARAQEAAVKYAEKQHRARAMMIARTELSFAYNRGAYEGIKQAVEMGLLPPQIKVWSTSRGGNVCSECEALEGEEVGMDDPFFDSRGLFKGDNLVPPLHPRCYCAIVYQEVETRDVGGLKGSYGYEETADLNIDEESAVTRQVSPDSYVFNYNCRSQGYEGLNDTDKKRYDDLCSAIDKLPKTGTTLNRSLCFSDEKSAIMFFENNTVGDTFKIKDFWSTTKNYVYNPKAEVQIYIQKPKSGADLGKYGLTGENEVLFKPGTNFRVDRKDVFEKVPGQKNYYIFLSEV